MNAQLPPSHTVIVRGADGTRLHTEVFGPADGYPIVLAHGITCALQVWREQIADLSRDYRVIAYDHRGHGRSGVPPRSHYTLSHLASDLDAVLEATLAPGERAVIAGHSMGGIAIEAWSERYRHRVAQRADAVALINTTTGDIVRQVKFLTLPRGLAGGRAAVGTRIVRRFGGHPDAARRRTAQPPLRRGAGRRPRRRPGDRLVRLRPLRADATGRAGRLRRNADGLAGAYHVSLAGLTVPTLVIGSTVTGCCRSRRPAESPPPPPTSSN